MRLRLLEAACLVVAKHGTYGLTVRAIAGVAKVSPGLINRYFPAAKEIYPELIQFIFDEYRRSLPVELAQLQGKERLLKSAQYSFNYFALLKPHHNLCVTHGYVYTGFDKNVREILSETVWGSIANVRRFFEQIKQASARDLDLISQAYMQMLEGALMHCTLLRTKAERQSFCADFMESLKQRIEDFERR